MRLLISLRPLGGGLRLPIHYNYLLQGAIYRHLGPDLAEWLHDRGFVAQNRNFRLFSFSRLMGDFRISKQTGEIFFLKDTDLVVTSPSPEFCTSLLNGLLANSVIRLGNSEAEIASVAAGNPKINDEEVILRTLSPIVTYSTLFRPEGSKYTCYYQPGEPEFAGQLNENLRKKYWAFFNQPPPAGEVKVQVRGIPRMSLVSYRGTVIKGYSCRLCLSGPRDLLQIGMEAGLNAKCSQGFGCVEAIR